MSPLRSSSLVLAFFISCIAIPTCAHAQERRSPNARAVVPDSCPITKPGDRPFTPPHKYRRYLNKASFWYGTDRLWIALPTSGVWAGLSHYEPGDPTFRQKIAWYRAGLEADDKISTPLKITGRRLEAPAPALLSDPFTGVSTMMDGIAFFMSGVNFPTHGCWEVTGRYQRDELTFVIWIAP